MQNSIVFVITKGEDDKVIYIDELPKYWLNSVSEGVRVMKAIKGRYVQDNYLGQQAAEVLAIDYDENLLLGIEFSGRMDCKVKVVMKNVR